ncbi:MAG TPA: MFS transporter [Micromonosporaceae bacterium]
MSRQTTRERIPQLGILVSLAVAEFVMTLDLSIVNVALPSIRIDLGFAADSLQWVVNAYALAFGGILLLGGRMADLFGRRRVFCSALAVFSLASLGCALTPGAGALVAARVVQGLGAGVLAPTTLSILTAVYPTPSQRNRALSIWTAVAIGGGAAGGVIGGVLTAALSWRWVFLVNVPVGTVLFGYGLLRLPREPRRALRERVDVAGAVTATAGLSALVWALVRAEVAGWGSVAVLSGLAAAALLLGGFLVIEQRLAHPPLVPLSVFRSRLVTAGNLLSFLSFVPVMATWYLLSIYLQRVLGCTPVEVGLWFLPMSLAVVGGSQVGFRLVVRVDARVLFGVGALLGAVGLDRLGRLSAGSSVVWVVVAATITMVGGGLLSAPITVAATSGLGPEQGGLAGGLLTTTRQVGGAVGLAVMGTLAAAHTGAAGSGPAAAMTAGSAAAFTTGALVFVVTAVVGALTLPARLAPPATATSPPGRHDALSQGRRATVRRG